MKMKKHKGDTIWHMLDVQMGGTSTLKDVYHNIVFNGGHTAYTLTPYSSRCTLSEGGIAVDTTNHTVYLYADFTMLVNTATNVNSSVLDATGFSSNYMPYVYNSSSATRGQATLTTDESSTQPTKNTVLYNYGSTGIGLTIVRGQGANINDHYIIYGSWKY